MLKPGEIRIPQAVYRDKVMGCWLGKNAGGTLGEPLEEKFGREEMFDVSWYPELPEGGIPNDDLELQLIWLQALQEVGPGLTANDLTAYWLDCVAYNFDEYGLAKSNMLQGLPAPVCGWHNNAFRDCMGSPIRSEIWACVAPGHPEIAAWYAYQDAICDHGGGESVYGEIYNAVVQSAAFVMDDTLALIQLGLDAIPHDCLTHQAIACAVEQYRRGESWVDCRNALKDRFYNPVAQYSPLNLGFQTVGWLYGEDFGDAICKAVNCGWDTDCTAATLGATLGIVMGAHALPKQWIEPLGSVIATNVTTGGIRNLTAPTDIEALTDAVCAQSASVLRYWGCDAGFAEGGAAPGHVDSPRLEWLADYRPDTVCHNRNGLDAALTYTGGHAALLGDAPAALSLTLRNTCAEPLEIRPSLHLPAGWRSTGLPERLHLRAGGEQTLPFLVEAETALMTGCAHLTLDVAGRPALPSIPVVLLGGSRWLLSPFFPGKTIDADCGVEECAVFHRQIPGWQTVWRAGNDLETDALLPEPGVLYALHHIWSEDERPVVVGVPNSGRMRIWQDGRALHRTVHEVPLRPNLGNGGALGDSSNYCNTALHRGWNQFLIKLERRQRPLQAHFTLGSLHPTCVKNHGGAVLGLDRANAIWTRGE